MALEIKQIEYKNFGRCLLVSNAIIEVIVTIGVGPRIISFSHKNGNNILFNDDEKNYKKTDDSFISLWGKDSAYYYYGGHRLELMPRSWPKTFYPDNDPVIYTENSNGATFLISSPILENVNVSMEIVMQENAEDIMIIHTIENNSKEQIITAISGSTQLKSNGVVIVPQEVAKGIQTINPNKSFAFWEYSKLDDKRINFQEKYITLRQDVTNNEKFKIGLNNSLNCVIYKVEDYMFMKNYVHNSKAVYPDFNSSLEIYVDENMVELSSISPLYNIESNSCIKHVENWNLKKCKDFSIPENIEDIDSLLIDT